MISVQEARERIVSALSALPAEVVSIADAHGRVLAEDVAARRTQPPTDVSAMDGYAVRAQDIADVPVRLRLIGESAAGNGFDGKIGAGETVRIFTGAPMPAGADTVVIQEDTEAKGKDIRIKDAPAKGRHVRKAGLDFSAGTVGLRAGKRLTARDIGLAAAMDIPWLKVTRRPYVAVLATGDELVRPGEHAGPDRIVSSNSLSVAALVKTCGGRVLDLGIARDTAASLKEHVTAAEGADLLVTIGGASVGDYDLVASVLGERGLEIDFWRIAMRPGKPLMWGRMGQIPVLGLPGNPVSAFVCAQLFLVSAIHRLLGGDIEEPSRLSRARLLGELPANSAREAYLRATCGMDENGEPVVDVAAMQDSSMLSTLATSNCLAVRPPHAPAAKAGTWIDILRILG